MNKEQRDRKRRFREEWNNSLNVHSLSYPMWLEKQLEHQITEVHYFNRICYHDRRRIEVFRQYVHDFETGMRIVERCARGTIGIETAIPPLTKDNDKEAVVSAIVSLYRVLQDAKYQLNQLSDAEKEAAKKHNEEIAKKYGYTRPVMSDST